MKKILLFLGACLFAFAASAETQNISQLVGSFTFDAAWSNGGAQAWYGEGEEAFDASNFQTVVVEYSDADVNNGDLMLKVEYADGTEAQETTGTTASGTLTIELAGTSIQQVYLMSAAGNYVENPVGSDNWEATTNLTKVTVTAAYYSSTKENPLNPPAIDPVLTASYDDLTLKANNNENYQALVTVPFTEMPAAGDYVKIEINGKTSADFKDLNIVIVDNTGGADGQTWWQPISNYYLAIEQSFKAGDEVNVSFSVKLDNAPFKLGDGVVCAIYTSSGIVDGLSSFVINENGEVGSQPYFDSILGELQSLWGDGNAVAGKTMTFAASNTGIGFANYNGGFDLSAYTKVVISLTEFPAWAEYGQIVVKDVNDDANTFSFDGAVATIDVSKIQANVKQLYLQCGGTGDVTLESIEFSNEPIAAVNEVESDFAIQNGMVYSAGEIVVYNAVGQVVDSASQEYNVASLAKGVYFISAQEGTIKFVK